MDCLPLPVLSVDKEYRIVIINYPAQAEIKKTFGKNMCPGDDLMSIIPKDELKDLLSLLQSCLAGEKIQEIRKHPLYPEILLELSFLPLYSGKEVDGIAIFVQDITKSITNDRNLTLMFKEQRLMMRLKELLSRAVDWTDAAPVALQMLVRQMGIEGAAIVFPSQEGSNSIRAYYPHLPKPPEELFSGADLVSCFTTQSSTQDIVHLEDLTSLPIKQKELLQLNNISSRTVSAIRVMDELQALVYYDAADHYPLIDPVNVQIIHEFADLLSQIISENVAVKRIMQFSQILQDALNSIKAPIMVVELESYIVLFMNEYAKDIYGEIEGKICWESCPEDQDGPCSDCPIFAKDAEHPEKSITSSIVTENGIRWFIISSTFIDWLDNRKADLQIALEITDRVMMENTLQQTLNELKDLNASKDKLFSVIAHDLKNPFMALLGLSELLKGHAGSLTQDEIIEFAGLIHSAADNSHKLLKNLLVWAQSQTGKIRFEPLEVDLENFASVCLGYIRSRAEEKHINLKKAILIHETVLLDPNLIGTILRNLLGNAVKFTPEAGTIALSIQRRDSEIEFCVSDTGFGMTDTELSMLFRIDSDTRKIGEQNSDLKGTGLGLIICSEFATLHGGRIEVESKPGAGTSFLVFVPYSVIHPAVLQF